MPKLSLILLLIFLCYENTIAQSIGEQKIPEVIITSKAAIKISGDTVNYTIDSFNRNPQATTEDILKKLPGVELSPDGKILVQGKEVTKIFINGEEYTSSNLKGLTQSLPANTLDRIEFADWVSEDARFMGSVTNRDEKIMHLKLKKEYNGGASGKITGGYGTNDRNIIALYGNYISTKARITLTADMNNTGTSSDNWTNYNSTGLNKVKSVNVDFVTPVSGKIKLNGAYNINVKSTNLESDFLRRTFLTNDSVIYQNKNSLEQTTTNAQKLRLKFTTTFDPFTILRTTVTLGRLSTNNGNTNKDETFYNLQEESSFSRLTKNSNKIITPNINVDNSLLTRFKKNFGALIFSQVFSLRSSDASGIITNENHYTPTFSDTNNFNATRINNNLNLTLVFQYTKPISPKSSVLTTYDYSYLKERHESKVSFIENDLAYNDSLQSNSYSNISREHKGGLYYQFKSRKFSLKIGGDAIYFDRQLVNNNALTQSGFSYFPNLLISYNTKKGSFFSLSYFGSIQPPTLNQLQPLPNYTDSLNIYIGNPGLKPEIRHNFSVNMNRMRVENSSWCNLKINITGRQIINTTKISASNRAVTPVNENGGYSISIACGHSFPVFRKKLKITLSSNAGCIKNISLTNGIKNDMVNYIVRPNAKITFIGNNIYEGQLYYCYEFNSTINNGAIGNTISQIHNLSLENSIQLPFNLRLYSLLNYLNNVGFSSELNNKNIFFINIGIEKKLKNFTLRVQGNNILDNNTSLQRFVYDNYIEDRVYNKIGRYYMISIAYNFKYFPKTNFAQ